MERKAVLKLSESEGVKISWSANQRSGEGCLPGELRQEAEAKGAKRAGWAGPSMGASTVPGVPRAALSGQLAARGYRNGRVSLEGPHPPLWTESIL